MAPPRWKSGCSASVTRCKAVRPRDRIEDAIEGSLRGTVDAANDWTVRSPRAPLPCHGCEYGGYRGTWSSLNESLLTYWWRNSVKDFPPSKPKRRISEIEEEEEEDVGALDAAWHAVSDMQTSGWRDGTLAWDRNSHWHFHRQGGFNSRSWPRGKILGSKKNKTVSCNKSEPVKCFKPTVS